MEAVLSPSVTSLIIAALILTVGLRRFESSTMNSRKIACIAVLSVVAAAGRVFFVWFPGFQPLTFIAVMAGLAMGFEAGFGVGVFAALLSNLFLGQGPWTPWQMLVWGLAGGVSGLPLIRSALEKKPVMITYLGLVGLLFGWTMNAWFWVSFTSPQTAASFLSLCAASLPFDIAHSCANIIFYTISGAPVAATLKRYSERSVVVITDSI